MSRKTPRLYEPIESLKEMYQKAAEKNKDKVLFRYFGKDGKVDSITYRQFSAKVDRIAAGLDSLGLCGKRVALIGNSSPDWIAVYLAVVSTGGVIIPIDKELLVDEISNFLNFAEADAFVFSRSFNKKIDAVSVNATAVSYFIPMEETEGYDFQNNEKAVLLSQLIEKGIEKLSDENYSLPENNDKNKMSQMLFTSGTTGTSKCVMLSENNICACINSACETVDFNPDDVIVSVLPLHHTYELACDLASMNYGMEICFNDSLKKVMKNFALFKPTGLILVPMFITTIYKKIWDEAKKSNKASLLKRGIFVSSITRKVGLDIRRNLFREVIGVFGGRLTKIVCGGAPLDKEMVKAFEEFGISIYEGYGITECSPLISVNPYFKPKAGSVGPSVPSCSVKIDGNAVGESGYVTGEILVKGKNVMLGYYKNDEATNEVFTSDGWFRTGDIGYLDDDGYIFITGRKKNVIVLSNGKNVFPEEIEEYLSKIDFICESVVVGRKDPKTDDLLLTAIIYPDYSKFDTDDMSVIADKVKKATLEINRTLPSFKHIRNIEIRKTEFEKTTTKKIKRYKYF